MAFPVGIKAILDVTSVAAVFSVWVPISLEGLATVGTSEMVEGFPLDLVQVGIPP